MCTSCYLRVVAVVGAAAILAGCQQMADTGSSTAALSLGASGAEADKAPEATMGVKELKSGDEFSQQVGSGMSPALVTFYDPASVSGKLVDPVLTRMDGMFGGKVKILKVNMKEQEGLMKEHNIGQSPTFVGFMSGKEAKRLEGPQPPAAIQSMIEGLLGQK